MSSASSHQIRDLEEELQRVDSRQESRMAGFTIRAGRILRVQSLVRRTSQKLARREGECRHLRARRRRRIAARPGTGAQAAAFAASERSLAELDAGLRGESATSIRICSSAAKNARVSLNLDAELRGLSFRIQEPAAMPLRPSGLRLMHVAGAGLALAVVAPVLLLLGLLKVDPRVRSPAQIERQAGLPVLGTIPTFMTRPRPRRCAMQRMAVA